MPEASPDNQPNPTQSTPSQPITQGINWKSIIIGVIIGTIVFGGGGFLVYNAYQPEKEEPVQTTTTTPKTATPSSKTAPKEEKPKPKDETADWKVYKDSEIQFRYPSNWKLTERNETKTGEVNVASPDYSASSPGAEAGEPALVINKGSMVRFFASKDYPEGKDLKEYLDENGFSSYYNYGNGTLTQTSLAGKKAIRVDTKFGIYATSEDFTSTSYHIVNQGKSYQISRIYKSGEQSKYESVFLKILSTFKFL